MTTNLAVFGDPVAHSLSPFIHQQFARHTGLDIDYQAIHASASKLPEALTAFRNANGQGANLTVPHKQTGFQICESLSSRAEMAGAVNTISRTDSGWHGDNTDGTGLLWDLQRLNMDIAGCRILIIGAGGAARGIIPALLTEHPAAIVIANRTASRASQLAEEIDQPSVNGCGLNEITAFTNLDLIIHASAAGHDGAAFSLSLADGQNPFCYDLSYGPAADPFLTWSRQRQFPSAGGLGMLIGQAAEAFQIWTDQVIGKDIRLKVLMALKEAS